MIMSKMKNSPFIQYFLIPCLKFSKYIFVCCWDFFSVKCGHSRHKDWKNAYLASIKGTVWPDWICMRVVSLESTLKGHQPLYVFNF